MPGLPFSCISAPHESVPLSVANPPYVYVGGIYLKRAWGGAIESDRRFGARLVRSRLPHLTPYRVRKIMRGLGIRGVTPNARKRTTIPDAGAPERPDLLKRDFTSPAPTYKPVGDITYPKTG